MTNKEILEKSIQKAIDGGWVDGRVALKETQSIPEWAIPTPVSIAIIFNHNFAKALWGDKEMRIKTDMGYQSAFGGVKLTSVKMSAWKNHLQQMVIADDPIKYLGENI